MKRIVLLFLVFILFYSCSVKKKYVFQYDGTKPIILVSKDSKNKFQSWLDEATNGSNVECFNMYSIEKGESLDFMLKKADGIIISGGEDVNPALYGKEDQIERCGTINTYRDSLEQVMINYALSNKIPLLGICRGHQIINVTGGGSLIIDIPEDIGSKDLHRKRKKRTRHMVYIEKDSYLYTVVKADSGEIISHHHQAVDRLADGFFVSAYAADKVVESVEQADTTLHPFILGLQWHPEGMEVTNPLSGRIALVFLKKVKEQFEKNE